MTALAASFAPSVQVTGLVGGTASRSKEVFCAFGLADVKLAAPGKGGHSMNTINRRLPGWAFALVAFVFSGGATLAQTAPSSSAPIQERINEVARALQSKPRLQRLSEKQRETLVNFIVGNMLFVMLHELGHGAVSEFNIPIVGREEDAADNFAIVNLLKVGSAFSHRILVEAARGWFLSDRRDRDDKEALEFYDEHSLDKQRAYQIVCVMVGSDPVAFRDLADETKLPEDRQKTCKRDYDTATSGWDAVMKPHRRSADQAKTKIDVTYGEGKGKFDAYAQGFRVLRMLDVVADRAADEFAWPIPFALETQSCGFINAEWVTTTHKLTLCYELADDFADLYRYNKELTPAKRKRKSK
jgi:Putative metallopeptidase